MSRLTDRVTDTLRTALGRQPQRTDEARSLIPLGSVDDYYAALNDPRLNVSASSQVEQTLGRMTAEPIGPDYSGMSRGAFKQNGVIFSCMLVRQLVFSAIRFQYQRLNKGRPSELYGDQTLLALEEPWQGGTTQDLLNRVIQDADLAGNSYWTPLDGEMVRLRPDWVQIILEPRLVPGMPTELIYQQGRIVRPSAILGYRKVGYVYAEGGFNSGQDQIYLDAAKVAHYAPIPDPQAMYRGMSWITPVIREIQADQVMTRHRLKFFEHGATPNLIIRHPATASPESVRKFRQATEDSHAGVDNAYRTLHLGGGADVTIAGANLQQVEFTAVQGHGETRIAAAAGVPPVIVGLSEGLQAATYSNYAQARRRFADGTMHPLWQNVAGSMAPLMPPTPPGVRLWYDTRDVPFLREDEKDAASIQLTKAQTIRSLVDGGYEPTSVMRAVESGDLTLLTHTGMFSVQLHAPGTGTTASTGSTPTATDAAASAAPRPRRDGEWPLYGDPLGLDPDLRARVEQIERDGTPKAIESVGEDEVTDNDGSTGSA